MATVATLAVGSPAFAAVPTVTAGASNQAAGDVTGQFANNFTAGSTLVFTIDGNDCSTPADLAQAVGFSSAPSLAVAPETGADASTKAPAFSTGVMSSTGDQCAANGVQDTVTFTTTAAQVGDTADMIDYTLSKIFYNVGLKASGTVTVSVTGLASNPSVDTATVVNKSFTFIPVIAAQEGSTGNALGTATFTEADAGAYFPAGVTTSVALDLADGTFTAGVTPKILVPSGYTVASAATTASSTYTFTVTAPATATRATVTVSGLKYDAVGTPSTDTVTATVTQPGPVVVTSDAMPAVNVLDFNDRSGGSDRYATAATVFNGEFGGGVDDVVLSGGELFPDALSANYLAGKLGTGTLLTKAASLPAVTRQAILSAGVSTVYITGQTGAVSESVANEIRSLHVGNVPTAAFISVVRLGGADRYATNKVVNEHDFTSSDTVLLAAGTGFADALALGPVAYSNGFPLILTKGGSLGATELSQLSDFSPTNVVIAGGEGVVSKAVADDLSAKGYNVLRLGGTDRTLTAAQIATWASTGLPSGTGLATGPATKLNSTTVYITNGLGFADALSAGPVAGANNRVILPTLGVDKLGTGIPTYLGTKTVGTAAGTQVDQLWALGLTGAVSNAVVKAAAATVGN